MGKTWLMVAIVALVFGVVLGTGMILGRDKREAASTEYTGETFPGEGEEIPEAEPTTGAETATGGQGQIGLDLVNLSSGMIVTSDRLTVTGKTAPRAEVAVNETETVADARGNFSVTIQLDEGENVINILVNDNAGNWVEKEITVNYEAAD